MFVVLTAAMAATQWEPSLGNYSMSISCAGAQRAFDRGLNLAFNFNQQESRAAFQSCAKVAPQCAMCFWGLAYAHAPFLNHPVKPAADVSAGQAAAKTAMRLSSQGGPYSAKETGLIRAMSVRYPKDAAGDQSAADKAYQAALAALHTSMPNDPDVTTFLAEALLLLECVPGGYLFYNADGTPKAGTSKAEALLRQAIAHSAMHPYAHHLYIHLAEPSRPSTNATSAGTGRSLPSASALASAFAGTDAQHLIHMPTHVYLRTGRYAQTVPLNDAAHRADERYLEHAMLPYGVAHDVAFGLYGACMAGMRATAFRLSATLVSIYATSPDRTDGPGPELGWNLRLTTRLRFGDWQGVVHSSASQPRAWPYSRVLLEYANGTALLKLGRYDEASQKLRSLESQLPAVDSAYMRYAKVAKLSLQAALEAGGADGDANLTAAIATLRTTVAEQSSWMYDEPPVWHMPMRQCLGTLQLRAKLYADACATFTADLSEFPNNGYSLFGLLQCMVAQPSIYSKSQLEATRAAKQRAWQDADVQLSSACLAFEKS